MRAGLAVLVVGLVVAAATAGTRGDILLPPLNGASGNEALLLVAPSGQAEYAQSGYVTIGEAVQAAAQAELGNSVRLWVSVVNVSTPDMDFDEFARVVAASIANARDQGFAGAPSDVHLAGHGLSARRVAAVVSNDPAAFGSAIFLGGFAPRTVAPLATFPTPALTLGGELDGLARVTRLAWEYEVFSDRADEGGLEDAALNVPVVILPGVSHGRFCCDVPPRQHDLEAEVSYGAAAGSIGRIVGAFVVAHSSAVAGDVADAIKALADAAVDSAGLVAPFTAAWSVDFGEWCRFYQVVTPNLDDDGVAGMNVDVTFYQYEDYADFTASKASYVNTSGSLDIDTHAFNNYWVNADDDLVTPASPFESPCKGYGQEFVLTSHPDRPVPLGAENTCAVLNAHAVDMALDLVSDAARNRYNSGAAKSLVFLTDVETAAGPLWLANYLSFAASAGDASVYQVQSAALPVRLDFPVENIQGNRYCKLLPVSRAVEWVLVDSLRPVGYTDPWEHQDPPDEA